MYTLVLDSTSTASVAKSLRTSVLSSFTKRSVKLEEVNGAENLHFQRLMVVCRASCSASTSLSSHNNWQKVMCVGEVTVGGPGPGGDSSPDDHLPAQEASEGW